MGERGGGRPERSGDWREALGISPGDFPDIPTSTSWPGVPAADAACEWEELRAWVEGLCGRFSHLDHHVIPHCWWRHNGHVEALVALRDHERSSFSDAAPASAPIEWFRALRDVTALLRAWTAELGCGGAHQAPTATLRAVDEAEWKRFVAADVAAREQAEIQAAAGG